MYKFKAKSSIIFVTAKKSVKNGKKLTIKIKSHRCNYIRWLNVYSLHQVIEAKL
jgi:hypothetical protein